MPPNEPHPFSSERHAAGMNHRFEFAMRPRDSTMGSPPSISPPVAERPRLPFQIDFELRACRAIHTFWSSEVTHSQNRLPSIRVRFTAGHRLFQSRYSVPVGDALQISQLKQSDGLGFARNPGVETGTTRSRSVRFRPITPHPGEVAEWPIAPVLKTGRGVSSSWVQIPPSPLEPSRKRLVFSAVSSFSAESSFGCSRSLVVSHSTCWNREAMAANS